ncbi:MAG TPA: DUF6325 family protein [Kineosporiaceae bacterium]
MDDIDETDETDVVVGPIDYLIVEFPAPWSRGTGLPLLVDLVDRNIIQLLDFVVMRKEADGSVRLLGLDELGEDGAEARLFDGASSGLLGLDDLEEAAKAVDPGSNAVVLVYENRWAAPFATAMRRHGGRLVAAGRIPVNDLIAALDADADTEPI